MNKQIVFYEQVLQVLKRGFDAEVRLDRNGELVVYEVKRNKANRIRKPLLNGR